MTRITDMTSRTLPTSNALVPFAIPGDTTPYNFDLATYAATINSSLSYKAALSDLAAATGPNLTGFSWGSVYSAGSIGAALTRQGTAQADLNITAGQIVNLYVTGGVTHMQLADASAGKPAHAFCPIAVASGATGAYTRRGIVPGTSGTAFAADLWLSDATPGASVASAPTTAGHLSQHVGMVLPGIGIEFDPKPEIQL